MFFIFMSIPFCQNGNFVAVLACQNFVYKKRKGTNFCLKDISLKLLPSCCFTI